MTVSFPSKCCPSSTSVEKKRKTEVEKAAGDSQEPFTLDIL